MSCVFRHAGNYMLARMMWRLFDQLIQHLLNYLIEFEEFSTDIHCPQRVNPIDFGSFSNLNSSV